MPITRLERNWVRRMARYCLPLRYFLHGRNLSAILLANGVRGILEAPLNGDETARHCQRNVGVPTNLGRLWFQAAI